MVSVVTAHLIGTVSLLVLFTMVGSYYTIYFSFLQSEVFASNLQEISEYVSAEIVDMVSLCSLDSEALLLIKELDIPKTIGGNAYNLVIKYSEDTLKVIAQQNLRPSVFGEAILPWATDGKIMPFNGTDPGINDSRVIPALLVSSISESPVVWCLNREGRIVFGLGLMKV